MLNTRSIVDFKCNLSLYLFSTDYKTSLKKVGDKKEKDKLPVALTGLELDTFTYVLYSLDSQSKVKLF